MGNKIKEIDGVDITGYNFGIRKEVLTKVAKAKELNEEYEVSEKAKKKAIETVKQVTEKLKENLKQ